MSRVKTTLPLLGAALLSGGLLMPPPAAAAPAVGTVTLFANHLDNPRALAVGPNGDLFVALSGHGGTDCPPQAVTPEGGPACFGTSGALVRLSNGRPVPVFSGLASVASPDGTGAEGPSGLLRRPNGWQVVMGLSSQQTLPGLTPSDQATSNAELGRLLSITDRGQSTVLADPGGDDYRWSQTHKSLEPMQFPDANPFNVVRYQGRSFVIDSGTNVLTEIVAGKSFQRVFFPDPRVSDSVPTCAATGPDGALYVGELTGAGNRAGAARIWRVVLGQKPQVWRRGFSNVTGCGFDSRGNFYATELQVGAFDPSPKGDPRGAVIKVSPNGTRTTLGFRHLFFPIGMAIKGNALYVSNWSVLTAVAQRRGLPTGQVVRIQL
jgi:hypothetical protein